MPVPPESIEVGKCYLAESGSVRKVTSTDSDGGVRYKERVGAGPWSIGRRIRRRHDFAAETLRAVPCDWTPEGDE